MALKQHFVVALPVYVHHNDKSASFRWLGAIIRSSDLHALRQPTEWCMLSGMRWEETWDHADWPIVVHLAGSPLVAVSQEARTFVTNSFFYPFQDRPAVTFVEPALVLDGSTSVQQQLTEAFSYQSDPNPFGLPDELSRPIATTSGEQLWLIMGAQTNEPAIRHRISGASRDGPAGRDPAQGLVVPELPSASE